MTRGRDSGMPAVEQWESYLDAAGILESLGCRDLSGDAIEFGCGYGTFTIVAARRNVGTVYALDIDPLMVAATAARVSHTGLKNVVVEQRDFVTDGCGRDPQSASLALLFNILHIEDPVGLLQEAYRVLRPGGLVGIIHWNCDIRTPRGPRAIPPRALCTHLERPAGVQCSSVPHQKPLLPRRRWEDDPRIELRARRAASNFR